MVGDVSINGKATKGLVLGIVGLVAWIIPLVGAPVTIIGLIFSIKGLRSLKRSMAIAGIVLSTIGLIATIINASIGAYQGATGQHSLINEFTNRGNTNSPSSSSDSKEEIIKQSIQYVKTQIPLPYKLDQLTTMVDVTAEPGAIRYHYILSGIDTNQINDALLKKGLLANICENKDTANILNRDINLEYSYSVENSTQKYFVSFTKSDCK